MSGSTIGPEHTPLLQSTTSTRLTSSNPTLPSRRLTRPTGFWPILKDQMSFAGKIAFAPIGLMVYGGADLTSEISALIKNRQASSKISKEFQSLKSDAKDYAEYAKAKHSLKLVEQKQKHAEQVYEGYKKIHKNDLSKIPSWVNKAKNSADNELREAKKVFTTATANLNLDAELLKKEKELEDLSDSCIKSVGEIIEATSDIFVGALSLPAEPLLLLFGGALAMRAFANASLSAASSGINAMQQTTKKTPPYGQTTEQIASERSKLASCPHVAFSEDASSITFTSWNMGMGDDLPWLQQQLPETARNEIAQKTAEYLLSAEGEAASKRELQALVQEHKKDRQNETTEDFEAWKKSQGMPRAEFSVKTAHELDKIKQMRDEMFTTYFKENKSDIMTLQEVTDIPRLQECLKRAGLSDTYGIYVDTSERPTDKVILYNKSRFQLIERDAPQGPKDRNLRHADIVLKDTRSGKEIVVASAHVPGFPDSDRDDKNATKTGTDEVIASCAALKQTSQVVLFGADLNDSRRVQHFVEAGFKSDSSSLPTRRHWDREKKAPASHERIDFALARNVKKLTPMKNGLSQVDSFGDQNPSDHLPVSSKVIY